MSGDSAWNIQPGFCAESSSKGGPLGFRKRLHLFRRAFPGPGFQGVRVTRLSRRRWRGPTARGGLRQAGSAALGRCPGCFTTSHRHVQTGFCTTWETRGPRHKKHVPSPASHPGPAVDTQAYGEGQRPAGNSRSRDPNRPNTPSLGTSREAQKRKATSDEGGSPHTRRTGPKAGAMGGVVVHITPGLSQECEKRSHSLTGSGRRTRVGRTQEGGLG